MIFLSVSVNLSFVGVIHSSHETAEAPKIVSNILGRNHIQSHFMVHFLQKKIEAIKASSNIILTIF